MMKNTLYARTGALPAIAAVLALSSTAAFAQEAQPVPTDSAPVTVAPPAPVVEAPAAQSTSESVAAPETSDTATTTSASPVAKARKPMRTAQRVVAPKVVTTRSNTSTALRAAAPIAAAEPAVAAAAPPAAPVASNAPTTTAPADVVAVQPAPTPVVTPAKTDRTLPIAGGALALLVLGGAAVAMNRRRRVVDEDVTAEDEQFVEQPIAAEPAQMPVARTIERPVYEEQPAIIAPPAFAWGKDQPLTTAKADTIDDADDRNPGESWMDRAHRGPSAGNPSVSLRNRLKRAAFFDKREREAAAGTAEPVDPTAGLPETMVEEQQAEHA